MKPSLGVGAVVLCVEGAEVRVCLVRRAKAPNKGHWSLPGGRVEWGESLKEALRREVQEETNLQVVIGNLIDLVEIVTDGYHYVVADYLCTLDSELEQQLRPGDDAADACWVRAEQLGSKGISPAVVAVVEQALKMWGRG